MEKLTCVMGDTIFVYDFILYMYPNSNIDIVDSHILERYNMDNQPLALKSKTLKEFTYLFKKCEIGLPLFFDYCLVWEKFDHCGEMVGSTLDRAFSQIVNKFGIKKIEYKKKTFDIKIYFEGE